jgi:hypothetical protein
MGSSLIEVIGGAERRPQPAKDRMKTSTTLPTTQKSVRTSEAENPGTRKFATDRARNKNSSAFLRCDARWGGAAKGHRLHNHSAKDKTGEKQGTTGLRQGDSLGD